MRAIRFALLLAVVTFVSSTPTVAAQPEAVTIHTVGTLVDGSQAGTFLASGAIADVGTYTFHEDVHRDFNFGAIGSQRFGIVRSVEFFAGSEGTFDIVNVIKYTITDDPAVFSVTGSWTVLSGTGAYAHIHGQGTIAGAITAVSHNELFDFTFDGAGHYQ
jgi:hypothetical protein